MKTECINGANKRRGGWRGKWRRKTAVDAAVAAAAAPRSGDAPRGAGGWRWPLATGEGGRRDFKKRRCMPYPQNALFLSNNHHWSMATWLHGLVTSSAAAYKPPAVFRAQLRRCRILVWWRGRLLARRCAFGCLSY
jgi:hypothetical protein